MFITRSSSHRGRSRGEDVASPAAGSLKRFNLGSFIASPLKCLEFKPFKGEAIGKEEERSSAGDCRASQSAKVKVREKEEERREESKGEG